MIKQVTVMRKDLHMRKGKMIAQGQHASMMFIIKRLIKCSDVYELEPIYDNHIIKFSKVQEEWLFNNEFAKICVYVNSEEELRTVMANAFREGLECNEIIDSGHTEFNGVPTLTCCTIGPDESEKIDKVTGHLKLL